MRSEKGRAAGSQTVEDSGALRSVMQPHALALRAGVDVRIVPLKRG
jgi:hypothetical protein